MARAGNRKPVNLLFHSQSGMRENSRILMNFIHAVIQVVFLCVYKYTLYDI